MTIPRETQFTSAINPQTGQTYQRGIPIGTEMTISKNARYQFAGAEYTAIFANRGAFGHHHYMESLIQPWNEVVHYDDMKGGYNVPIGDFTDDNNTARVWLCRDH